MKRQTEIKLYAEAAGLDVDFVKLKGLKPVVCISNAEMVFTATGHNRYTRALDFICGWFKGKPPKIESGKIKAGAWALVLKSFGSKKIQAIKSVREITGIGIKEAKKFVESLESIPGTVGKYPTREEAQAVYEKHFSFGPHARGCDYKIAPVVE